MNQVQGPTHRATLGGETVEFSADTMSAVLDALVAKHGGVPQVAKIEAPAPEAQFSDLGEGNQVIDETAKARIEKAHKALAAGDVFIDKSQQAFADGTRMAREGYATQAARQVEHEQKGLASDAAKNLRDMVLAEKREDREVSSREIADAITVNGKVKAFGLRLTEQAMRGLILRIDSPAIGYLLGLRDRIAEESSKPENERNVDGIKGDRARIAETIRHECLRNPDVAVKLRTRASVGDIFASVSPSYVPADAPEIIDQLIDQLPPDARGSFAYDGTSTGWELRAEVWTPTPVAEQAVGEPFRGYVSLYSRDNGTSRFTGGGGVEMLRCLNATTYTSGAGKTSRVHRGRIMLDIDGMMRESVKAIHVLCTLWGKARTAEVELPESIPLSKAIPGLYRGLLTDRQSELVRVLPGRVEQHVKALAGRYESERRDDVRIVRSDLAQGWTRYIQDQAPPVRRDAERAIGDWLASSRPVPCVLE